MTVYPFATMTQDEANRFSVEVDVVRFTISAASLVLTDTGGGLIVEAQGRILNFPFSPDRLAYDNFEFADGSQLLVGDADIQTSADAAGNQINGTEFPDLIFGRGGDDLIAGYGGADLIFGNQGNDYVRGTAGRDTVYGGQNNDQIDYSASPDGFLAQGNLGADILVGGSGADSLYGGQDNDTLLGGDGADYLSGDLSNDILRGGPGNDTLLGGDGDDTLSGGEGDDLILGNRNNDDIIYRAEDGPAGRDTVFGGNGSDRINYAAATTGVTLFGNTETDYLNGSQDADQIYGGRDDDFLYGNAGNDGLFGDNGNDYVDGGTGNDAIDGGAGDDIIYGGDPQLNEIAPAEAGADIVFGGDGNDTIVYKRAREVQFISGGAGDDIVLAGYADDLVYGNEGNDTLQGSRGADSLYGGQGSDTLTVGTATGGVIVLSGDRDGDTYRLSGSLGEIDNAGARHEIRIAAGDSGYVRGAVFDGTASDFLVGFRQGRDVIVTGIAANAANFRTAFTDNHAEAQTIADGLVANGATYAYVTVSKDGDTRGYLFWDVNGDRQIDSELGSFGQAITAASII